MPGTGTGNRMKRHIAILITAAALFTAGPVSSATWYAGASAWAMLWDPGALRQYQSALHDSSTDITEINREFAKGTMAGPVLGFRSQNKKWRVRASYLAWGSFNQDMRAQGYDSINTQDFTVDFDISLARGEFRGSVSYAPSAFIRFFAGYTHQYYTLELESSYTDGAFSSTWRQEYNAVVYMPAAGVVLCRDLPNGIFLDLRLGIIYTIPSIDVTMYDINTGNSTGKRSLRADSGPGFTSEAAAGFRVIRHVLIRAGYRFESFRYRLKEGGTTGDTTQGVTLSASLIF